MAEKESAEAKEKAEKKAAEVRVKMEKEGDELQVRIEETRAKVGKEEAELQGTQKRKEWEMKCNNQTVLYKGNLPARKNGIEDCGKKQQPTSQTTQWLEKKHSEERTMTIQRKQVLNRI